MNGIVAHIVVSAPCRSFVAFGAIADSDPAELSVDLWAHGLVT